MVESSAAIAVHFLFNLEFILILLEMKSIPRSYSRERSFLQRAPPRVTRCGDIRRLAANEIYLTNRTTGRA
jgi:hypothetical protein